MTRTAVLTTHAIAGGDAWVLLYRPALLLSLIVLCAYAYVVPTGDFSNGDSHLALTRAIVDDHSLRIDRYAAGLTDRALYKGHYYSDKAPGLAFLALPVYAVLRLLGPAALFAPANYALLRYLVTLGAVAAPAAAFAGLLWLFLLPILGRVKAALLVLGFSLGTIAWSLSSLMFSHIIAAMGVFGAVMLLYPISSGRRLGASWRWGGAGLLCGMAVACEYTTAAIAAVVAFFAAYTAWQTRPTQQRREPLAKIGVFVTMALLGVAPLLVYDTAVYGSPFSLGYAHLGGEAVFTQGMSRNIAGVGLPNLAVLWAITFSGYRGLFILSPFLLLAAPGLLAMGRRVRQRPAALLCGSGIGVMLLVNSGYVFWDGGASIGPRHLGSALPFFLLPIAFSLRRWPWSKAAAGLIALSIAIVSVCVLTTLLFEQRQSDPVIDVAMPRLLQGPAPSSWGFVPRNWGLIAGAPGPFSAAPLLAVETLLGFLLWRVLHAMHQRTTPSRSAAVSRLIAHATYATTLSIGKRAALQVSAPSPPPPWLSRGGAALWARRPSLSRRRRALRERLAGPRRRVPLSRSLAPVIAAAGIVGVAYGGLVAGSALDLLHQGAARANTTSSPVSAQTAPTPTYRVVSTHIETRISLGKRHHHSRRRHVSVTLLLINDVPGALTVPAREFALTDETGATYALVSMSLSGSARRKGLSAVLPGHSTALMDVQYLAPAARTHAALLLLGPGPSLVLLMSPPSEDAGRRTSVVLATAPTPTAVPTMTIAGPTSTLDIRPATASRSSRKPTTASRSPRKPKPTPGIAG